MFKSHDIQATRAVHTQSVFDSLAQEVKCGVDSFAKLE